jgi:glycosyltransferase involved in cell wall biosynthesis
MTPAPHLPLVSLCLPAYNHAPYVEEALRSLMAQTYPNLEILVLNNGSDDATGDICDAVARDDARVKVTHRTPSNGPTSHSQLLRMAAGDYICLHSADDVFFADKTTRQLAYLQANPHLVAAFTWAKIIDEHGEALGGPIALFNTPYTSQQLCATLLNGNVLCLPSVMMPRAVVQQMGGLDTSLEFLGDYDYWLRLLKLGDIGILPEQLLGYRVHPRSSVRLHSLAMQQETWRVLLRHAKNVLLAHPEVKLAPGALFRSLAHHAFLARDWEVSQRFTMKKVAECPMDQQDALQLTYCLLRLKRIEEPMALVGLLLEGKLPASMEMPQSAA